MSSASNNPPSLYSKSASLKLSYLPPVLLLEARITPLVSITVLAYLVIQNLVGSNNTDFSIIQVPDPTKLAYAARHQKASSSIRSLAPAPLKANVSWPWHSHSMQRSQLYMAHRLPFKLSTTSLAWTVKAWWKACSKVHIPFTVPVMTMSPRITMETGSRLLGGRSSWMYKRSLRFERYISSFLEDRINH